MKSTASRRHIDPPTQQFLRLLLGMTEGIVITVRTSLRELCGREHVVTGVVYIGGAWAIGLITGTGIGGLLSAPAVHYPRVFSTTGMFGRYPFLLPNLFGAFLAALTLPVLLFWYPETKGFDKRQGDGEFKRLAPEGTADTHVKVTNYGGSISTTFNNAGDNKTTVSKGDVEQGNIEECERVNGMQTRLLLRLLFLGCTVQMVFVGYNEVFPLWMMSTSEVGGLGWATKKIGQLVLATGILFGVLQFTLLPFMTRLVGIVRWYRIGWVLTVVSFLLIPNAKTFSWNSSSLFAVGIMSNLLYNCSSSAVSVALTVAATNSFPPQHRGKLSGLYNTAENLGRFFGPASFSTIYALSISYSANGGEETDGYEISWLDHRFVFYASGVVLASLAGIGWRTLTSEIFAEPVSEEVE